MNMKKFVAGFASAIVAASAAMAVSASAAEVAIDYTQSEAATSTLEDGHSLRINLYNTWGNSITDLNPNGSFNEKVVVNFTVSGIGDTSTNDTYATDGTVTTGEQLYAFLGGSIGGNARHTSTGLTGEEVCNINGDGDYSVAFLIPEASETIECLYLQTNINFYNFGVDGKTPESIADTAAKITINSVTTESAPEDPEDPAVTTATTEASTDDKTTTTAKPAGDTKTTTAAKKDDKKTTTTAKKGETAAATGDAGVVTAVAALGAAAACAFVVRKRK